MQTGRLCPGPICTVVQNFTPIGVTVAEIYVTMGREYAYAKMEYASVRTCLSTKKTEYAYDTFRTQT